jgi:hypothetical protein
MFLNMATEFRLSYRTWNFINCISDYWVFKKDSAHIFASLRQLVHFYFSYEGYRDVSRGQQFYKKSFSQLFILQRKQGAMGEKIRHEQC